MTNSSIVARVVGRVDANGDIDTTTALMDFADASNPGSVASPNGIDLWVGGGDGGLRYTVLGSTTSTQVNSTLTNLRGIGIFGGRLYVSYSSDSAGRIAIVGAGLPILSGRKIANAPGFQSGTGGPCGFFDRRRR